MHPHCISVWLHIFLLFPTRTHKLEKAELTTSLQQSSPTAEWRQNVLAAASVFICTNLKCFFLDQLQTQHFEAKHSDNFVNNYNQNVCFFGRVFVAISQKIFCCAAFISQPVSVLDVSSQSWLCFSSFTNRSSSHEDKMDKCGTLVEFFHRSFNNWTQLNFLCIWVYNIFTDGW